MDNVIPFLQVGEINIQRRACRLGVGRFEPARALDLIASENLGIGDNDQFGLFAQEAARERAQVNS